MRNAPPITSTGCSRSPEPRPLKAASFGPPPLAFQLPRSALRCLSFARPRRHAVPIQAKVPRSQALLPMAAGETLRQNADMYVLFLDLLGFASAVTSLTADEEASFLSALEQSAQIDSYEHLASPALHFSGARV